MNFLCNFVCSKCAAILAYGGVWYECKYMMLNKI